MKFALLVVDMQKGLYDDPVSCRSMDFAQRTIIATIDLFHEHNFPVIYIQSQNAGDGPGSRGFEILDGFKTIEKDLFIVKSKRNSFWETSLEKDLRNLSCDYLIVCGYAAAQCVDATYCGAFERNFKCSILQHGIAGWKRKHIETTHEVCNVISLFALKTLLNDTK